MRIVIQGFDNLSTSPQRKQGPALLAPRAGVLALVCALVSPGLGLVDEKSAAGQEDETWWSLQPIVKPALPPPSPKHPDWNHNPIDRFLLGKLREKGFEPSPPADRRTLLRRVKFDLVGLPPTPEEIDAFLNDKSPNAYEKVVDRLLASPHYGERWARHWMDVIHFAETHGHDQDVPRENAWPYRDYLIQAFNNDKAYRRFVEEQIAGDILYPNDSQAIPALGFLAAGPWDESSLRDIREDSIDRKAGQYLDRDDMIGTMSLAFLSTTAQCARCHDHKFDPIGQEEYYRLQAVFAGVDRVNRPFDDDSKVHACRRELTRKKAELAQGTKLAAELLRDPSQAQVIAAWEREQASAGGLWKVLPLAKIVSKAGATPVKQPDGSIRFEGTRPEKDTYLLEAETDAPLITGLRLEVLSDPTLPSKGPGRHDNGNFHLNEIKIEVTPRGESSSPAGPDLTLWGVPLAYIHLRKPAPIARASADFNQFEWDIAKAIDGKMETAWGIYPAVGQNHVGVFVFKEPLRSKDKVRLIVTLEQQHGKKHTIGRLRLSVTAATKPDELGLAPPAVQATLSKPLDQRTEAEKLELARYVFLTRTEAELAALPKPKLVYAAAADFVPEGTFKPAKGCRPIHVLKRGDIKRPGKEAKPGALEFISTLSPRLDLKNPTDEGERRAALAKWISDPKNPLTWRSIVNRVWQHHFGRGLVVTANDFGRMGAKPTHPELLDWLAATFLEDGGSLKKLHRRIVTSAAYRQSSRHNAEYAKVDGDNAYLWRMNRTRLDAESVRDAVLFVAGKLDTTMGGPSVKHFKQSPGIHRTPKVDYDAFDPDSPGAHRRSIYRFIFRTVPDPFMDALDCPDASQFIDRRTESVTPLQALALLNDPFMVRMSEHFAKRLATAGAVENQVKLAYRLALGREATEREAENLASYATRHGMPNACRLLLNCNEFMFVP